MKKKMRGHMAAKVRSIENATKNKHEIDNMLPKLNNLCSKMTLPKLNNLCAKMTTTDFKLTRTADQRGKTTRNQSTNASFFVITA